jgi:transcriptional regulator with XRE-family HTH domain
MRKHKPRGNGRKTATGAELMSNRLALKALRTRAGLSAEECGKATNLSAQGYLRYENTERFDTTPIPARVIIDLAPIMQGKGSPPITLDEMFIISELRGAERLLKQPSARPVAPAAPPETAENMVAVNALVQKYTAERGAYRELAKAAAGFPSRRVSPLFALRSYPQDRQWVCVILDDQAASLGFPAGTNLHCVDYDAIPRMKLAVGSVVVALHKRDGDLGEIVVCYISEMPPNGVVLKMADGSECAPADVLGVALYAYGPVTLRA